MDQLGRVASVNVGRAAPTSARPPERWQIGTVELEVSGPRVPCAKLGARMGDPPR
jgi:MOSC domain-containing protein YiiM